MAAPCGKRNHIPSFLFREKRFFLFFGEGAGVKFQSIAFTVARDGWRPNFELHPYATVSGRYGYYEQGGLADMNEETRVMELVEDTVRPKNEACIQEREEGGREGGVGGGKMTTANL